MNFPADVNARRRQIDKSRLLKLRMAALACRKHEVMFCVDPTLILDAIPSSEDIEQWWDPPRSGAQREGPCWCNGPYKKHESHHGFCQVRREAWFAFLRALETDIDDDD